MIVIGSCCPSFKKTKQMNMKRSILILATGIFLVAGMSMFTSCESSEHSEHKEQLNTNDGDIYACPMHHGTTGKKGDVCET